MARRLGVTVDPAAVAACVGTKELVAGLPQWLRLRRPDRDTVLYPAISYPTYAMGAMLAGCRAVPVRLPRADIDEADAERALCLWVNVPGNPDRRAGRPRRGGGWGRARGVPVLSDECYVEFTWDGPPRTILEHGPDGVLAVHSLSKRSNLAGVRAGFYAGDADLVHYLSELRKHAGLHGARPGAGRRDRGVGRRRPRRRAAGRVPPPARPRCGPRSAGLGLDVPMPGGAFYLWAAGPRRRRLGPDPAARRAGRRPRVAGRVLRPGGRRVRPGRRGPARRPHRAGGRTPGLSLRPS